MTKLLGFSTERHGRMLSAREKTVTLEAFSDDREEAIDLVTRELESAGLSGMRCKIKSDQSLHPDNPRVPRFRAFIHVPERLAPTTRTD